MDLYDHCNNDTEKAFTFIGALDATLKRDFSSHYVTNKNGDMVLKKETPADRLNEIKRLLQEYDDAISYKK